MTLPQPFHNYIMRSPSGPSNFHHSQGLLTYEDFDSNDRPYSVNQFRRDVAMEEAGRHPDREYGRSKIGWTVWWKPLDCQRSERVHRRMEETGNAAHQPGDDHAARRTVGRHYSLRWLQSRCAGCVKYRSRLFVL